MFKIEYRRFSHINQRDVREKNGGIYRTKREALVHLRANNFVDFREFDSRLTERKLPDTMYNPSLECEAYIFRA